MSFLKYNQLSFFVNIDFPIDVFILKYVLPEMNLQSECDFPKESCLPQWQLLRITVLAVILQQVYFLNSHMSNSLCSFVKL